MLAIVCYVIASLILIYIALLVYGKYLWYKQLRKSVAYLCYTYAYAMRIDDAEVTDALQWRSLPFALFHLVNTDLTLYTTPYVVEIIKDYSTRYADIEEAYAARLKEDSDEVMRRWREVLGIYADTDITITAKIGKSPSDDSADNQPKE